MRGPGPLGDFGRILEVVSRVAHGFVDHQRKTRPQLLRTRVIAPRPSQCQRREMEATHSVQHDHARETVIYEMAGVATRFVQSAAIIGPSTIGDLTFPSGVTLYTVRNGVIDEGRFIPLGLPDQIRP